MTSFDNTLLQLQQQVALKDRLEAKLDILKSQRRSFDRQVVSLRVEFRDEQADVEKLEGRSLANYFFQVIGKLDEKLDEERRQAAAAKVKLDAVERELAAVDREIHQLQAQLLELGNCEEAFTDALEHRRRCVKASGTPAAGELLRLEEQAAFLESQLDEIREAIRAGQRAMSAADSVLSELDDAEGWNTWDMFGGGGIITHIAKHSHLDEAQEQVEHLQGMLRSFQTELADIHIHGDMQVSIDGFLRFADYFFDGLFADWAVGDKISQSQASVQKVREQIQAALSRLRSMESVTEQKIASLAAKAEALLVGS